MAKIPFNIKFRPQIESGEYKVETRDGRTVRIICWDRVAKENTDADLNICVLVPEDKGETVYYYHHSGKKWIPEERYDLFIITPEEELSEFEKAVGCAITDAQLIPRDKDGIANIHDIDEFIRKKAAELLTLSREQFIKDGYVIEKKTFHDAVENISDKYRAQMLVEFAVHCKVEDGKRNAIMNWEAFQKVAQRFIDIGKADALKDLPRWKKERPTGIIEERIAPAGLMDAIAFYYNGQTYYIKMEDLAAFFEK